MDFKRLIVICEGETERDFCQDILREYFIRHNIQLECPRIKRSNGGIVSWPILKKEIVTHLKQNPKAFVTTFIDYYRLPSSFPHYSESKAENNRIERMHLIEHAMHLELNTTLQARFIPYIQLHEFEALLFCDPTYFEAQFDIFKDKKGFEKIFTDFGNPELINDIPEKAPYARIKYHIPHYEKGIDNLPMAKSIGLKNIMARCKKFENWIDVLTEI